MIAQLDSLYIKTRPQKVIPRLVSYALFEGRPLTTKGQWINPLVFAHFALETKLLQLKEVRGPVFIVGTGRSGSTILGMLLIFVFVVRVQFLNDAQGGRGWLCVLRRPMA